MLQQTSPPKIVMCDVNFLGHTAEQSKKDAVFPEPHCIQVEKTRIQRNPTEIETEPFSNASLIDIGGFPGNHYGGCQSDGL
jgi:hypothetical protein